MTNNVHGRLAIRMSIVFLRVIFVTCSNREIYADVYMAQAAAISAIMMNTMVNSSTSKIAEMMINGSTMGIIDLGKRVKQAQSEGVSEDVVKIANDMMSFEEGNIQKMKTYL